ncbi:MAG: uncharacterized protein V7632_820 [Bradyrhizobium sp.]|jgi:uncharacterized OB-fold protein
MRFAILVGISALILGNVANPETAPFWDAAKAGKLLIKRCTACGEAHYSPRSICPFCFSDRTVWEES